MLWASVVLLQGCTEVKVDTGEAIGSPQNKLIPIKGTWLIEGMKKIKNSDEGESSQNPLLGKQAAFDKNMVLLGNEVCENPEYKIRSVRAKDYFLYTYQIPYKTIGSMDTMIEIISVTANGQHFYDFILISDQQLIVHKEDAFFYLKHISADVDPRMIDKIDEENVRNDPEIPVVEPSLLRSGVLLGLRAPVAMDGSETPGKDWGGEETAYRTLWIAAKNRKLYDSQEIKNLLVPRKNGFWIVAIDRKKEEDYLEDHLTAHSVESKVDRSKKIKGRAPQQYEDSFGEEPVEKEERVLHGNLFKRIRFIGNDYAAIEYHQSWEQKAAQKIYLQLMPIDNINNGEGIFISDVAGEEGKGILLNSAQGYLSNLHGDEISKLEDKIREDHFTLDRRNGHWMMKGRLYYSDIQEETPYFEYSINMIPPSKIVNYDELYVSWNKIKEKVPEAIDAFVSPNKEMAVVITESFIYAYRIMKGELVGKPLEKIELLKGETVVMAEWATGNYVEKWKKLIHEVIPSKE